MNKPYSPLYIFVFVLVAVIGWLVLRNNILGQSQKEKPAVQETQVKLISPQELSDMNQNSEVFIVDVHTPEQTHIPGTDAFIPFDQIEQNIDKLPTDKSTPIVVYCRSGGMSAQASAEIAALGYSNVYDLEGGTNVYKEQQVSVELWPSHRELGTVIYGDIASTSFTFTNYTPLPIEITRVSTSCGCTKANVDQKKLGAYESTQVNVTFDPAVHKDDTDLGDITRNIYLETDNPNFPQLETMISAKVVKKQ